MLTETKLTRRGVMTGAATAAIIVAGTPLLMPIRQARAAQPIDLGAAGELRNRVSVWLQSLEPEAAARAHFPFGGDVQTNWNFMGGGGFIKPGYRLEEMSGEQKDLAWHALAAVLSPRGLSKTRDVMTLQSVLMEQGNGVDTRGEERFSLAVFGEPAPEGAWALRFEGHHLSLTFNIANDRLVGVTPSSFSVNPNRVESGRNQGLITLKREDDIARKLAEDLSGSARDKAFFRDEPLRNVQALARREAPFAERAGVAVADLSTGQRDLLTEVIDAFTAEHLNPTYAASVAARVSGTDAFSTHFAFSGSTRVGEPAYYRIHGDNVLIEFASVDAEAQHLHTVFHLS
jgi:hypothetical protein